MSPLTGSLSVTISRADFVLGCNVSCWELNPTIVNSPMQKRIRVKSLSSSVSMRPCLDKLESHDSIAHSQRSSKALIHSSHSSITSFPESLHILLVNATSAEIVDGIRSLGSENDFKSCIKSEEHFFASLRGTKPPILEMTLRQFREVAASVALFAGDISTELPSSLSFLRDNTTNEQSIALDRTACFKEIFAPVLASLELTKQFVKASKIHHAPVLIAAVFLSKKSSSNSPVLGEERSC
mmetsp:Transcript_11423/g.24097  ORF Transcript_11423/g.24097 Transcript_11423/m.24097 type:complete len:240 (-) Transcript_11423:295-1014(-)